MLTSRLVQQFRPIARMMRIGHATRRSVASSEATELTAVPGIRIGLIQRARIWLGLFLLKKFVDPEFSKLEFLEGARQALQFMRDNFTPERIERLRPCVSPRVFAALEDTVKSMRASLVRPPSLDAILHVEITDFVPLVIVRGDAAELRAHIAVQYVTRELVPPATINPAAADEPIGGSESDRSGSDATAAVVDDDGPTAGRFVYNHTVMLFQRVLRRRRAPVPARYRVVSLGIPNTAELLAIAQE